MPLLYVGAMGGRVNSYPHVYAVSILSQLPYFLLSMGSEVVVGGSGASVRRGFTASILTHL